MSIDSTRGPSTSTDAANEAYIEHQHVDAQRRSHSHRRRKIHHRAASFKPAQHSSPARKAHDPKDGRQRLANGGLFHRPASLRKDPSHHQGGGSKNGRGHSQHGGSGSHRGRDERNKKRDGDRQQRDQKHQQQQQQKRAPAGQAETQRSGDRAGGFNLSGRAISEPTRIDGVGSSSNASRSARPQEDTTVTATTRARGKPNAPVMKSLQQLVQEIGDRPLMLESEFSKELTELQLRTGVSEHPMRAQIELMLDSRIANGLLNDSHINSDTLDYVIGLIADARIRMHDATLPDQGTEAAQSWYALNPLALLTHMRRQMPVSLRERSIRYLKMMLSTLSLLPG